MLLNISLNSITGNVEAITELLYGLPPLSSPSSAAAGGDDPGSASDGGKFEALDPHMSYHKNNFDEYSINSADNSHVMECLQSSQHGYWSIQHI
jgi:hypothetical protein